SGLVKAIGQDAVQALMVEAFAPLRDDLPGAEKQAPAADTFADACRRADEKQRRRPPDPRLERLRRLMDDDISIERAHAELKQRVRGNAPIATLQTAEYLAFQQNDLQRLKDWLARHSREDREVIRKHLRNKRGPSCQ